MVRRSVAEIISTLAQRTFRTRKESSELRSSGYPLEIPISASDWIPGTGYLIVMIVDDGQRARLLSAWLGA